MERLTERTAVGILVKEDYGEKVLRTLYSCYGGKPNPHYTNCEEGYCAMEKLAAYEDAEEQGLLLRLPCEVGAAVFEIVELLECKYDYECPFDDLYDVNKCEDPDRTCENEYTSHIVIEKKFDISMLDKIGKNVFLEKEDAENKLKEMEENHGNWRRKHDER